MTFVMLMAVTVVVFADDVTLYSDDTETTETDTEGKLCYNEDGTFTILMINDTQDVGKCVNSKMLDFVEASIIEADPDLVVLDGDQLADIYPFATAKDIKLAIDNVCSILEEYQIPFLVTLGNHDHDRESVVSEAEQYAIYTSYSMCYNVYADEMEGDYFTCALPIYSSDGSTIQFAVFVIDSNNTSGSDYIGDTAEQVEWYIEESEKLNEEAGTTVPVILFQHIPVNEIYTTGLMQKCSWNTDGAIYSRRDSSWYILADGVEGELGEAPCSEPIGEGAGMYDAWVEQGNIIGAWFAHDHVNTFSGVDDNGILMGYNGGCGFRAYGNGDERTTRVFNFTEGDEENYSTSLIYYDEVCGSLLFVISDILTPEWLTWIMKPIYALFGWMMD